MRQIAQRVSLVAVGVVILWLNSTALAASTWSNAGIQSLIVHDDFYPSSMTRYVAPGCKISFRVVSLIDEDTETVNCIPQTSVDDSDKKEGRLRKSGGTVGGQPWSATFTQKGSTLYTYEVPADATPGQTITIVAEIHDTRDASDPRHDDWSTKETWNFTVSTDCPDTMTVDALDDQSGARPATGESYGQYRATMKASGTPPAGRSNWNGTTVTETVGALAGNAAEWAAGIIGTASESDVTYTFGTAANDKFYDEHSMEYAGIALATGVNTASCTSSQVYKCSATKSYTFIITRTGNRLDAGGANERVKITTTKS